jgi:hypothetical protein
MMLILIFSIKKEVQPVSMVYPSYQSKEFLINNYPIKIQINKKEKKSNKKK